jgi:predicted helicase
MVVLFDRLNVGKTLYSELKDRFQSANVFYIDGNIDVSVREGIRKSLEEMSGNILIAQTVTASVGLNIKNLNGIVFAFSGRSYVRIIQSIGRVIRKKKDKSVAKLYEVWYNLKYSTKHHGEKMEILADNYGEKSIRDAVTMEIEV